MRAVKERWRRWRVTLRKVFRRVVYSRSSTQSIAAGVALGVFVGLTPTVGFQMVIAALLATILGVNRLAAVLPVWITNPFTIAPIYYFEYRVGSWVWPAEEGPHIVGRLEALAEKLGAVTISDVWGSMGSALAAMGHLGAEILVPLILGSLVVGVVCAAAAYPATLWAVARIRKQRQLYTVRRAERRIATLKAAGLFQPPEEDEEPGDDAVAEDGRAAPEADAPRSPQIVSLPRARGASGAGGDDDVRDPPARANGA
jgi:hypothetical protein